MNVVAEVEDSPMTVVDLEKIEFLNRGHVFSGYRPAEVGMIEVGKHRLAGLARLLVNGLDIDANGVLDRLPFHQ